MPSGSARRLSAALGLVAPGLVALAVAACKGGDTTGPDAQRACSATLATTTAAPMQTVLVHGVPDSLAADRLFALVRAGGAEGAAIVERLPNGDVSVVAPLHPSGALAGGPVELVIGAGAVSCPALTLAIAPLAEAPGTAEAVAAELQGILDALAADFGASTTLLKGGIDALPPELLPLGVAQRFLDHPENPNSLVAQLAGTAPALAGTAVDARLLDALLASSGVLTALDALADSLAAFGPPPAEASASRAAIAAGTPTDPAGATGDQQATAAAARTMAAIGPSGIRTAAQLDYWMARRAAVARLADREMAHAQAQLSLVLSLASFVPGAAGATTVAGTMLFFNQLLVDGLQKLLPSRLTALTFDVDRPVLDEDETTAGRWSNARLTAQSETWSLAAPTVVDGLLTAWGVAGTGLKRVIAANPIAKRVFDNAVEKLITVVGGTLNTLAGLDTGDDDDGTYGAGPFTYGPVDVGGARWTQVVTAPAGVLRLPAGDRTAYLPEAAGTADLILRVLPPAFQREAIEGRQRIQVAGLEVAVTPTSRRMRPGETFDFAAIVTHAADERVTWSATGGSVSTTGRYTAPATTGTYTVTVASVSRPDRRATATVTVTNDILVTVTPASATLAPGEQLTFGATLDGATTPGVTWSASAGTITAGGLFTAPATEGTVTVTARSVQDPSATATATVLVREPPPSRYTVTLVRPISGLNDDVFSLDVNSAGQVSGVIAGGGYILGFRWHAGTGIPMTRADVAVSHAYGINEAGQVAGRFMSDDGVWGFLWSAGTTTDIGRGAGAEAFALNDAGQVVGLQGGNLAFAWQAGTTTLLPLLPGDERSVARGINNAGQIVGTSSGATTRAVIWEGGSARPLPVPSGTLASDAHGINGSGHVVGTVGGPGGYRPVLWRDGAMIDLGTLAGGRTAWAGDINDQGQIVGYSNTDSGSSLANCRAVLWENGTITTIDALIPAELRVQTWCGSWGSPDGGGGVAIGNGGHIVVAVRSTVDGGRYFALLTPKP